MNLLSFDLETHLIQPGNLAPPIVCLSAAWRESGCEVDSVLHEARQARFVVRNFFGNYKLVGANIAYDFGCLLAEDPTLFPLIWKAYENGEVFDVLIASSLNAIADGRMRDGDLFRRDGSKIQSGRYSLDECVKEWLGRGDAKRNDRWRKSYALLERVPLEQWPDDARQYPVDDAVNTLLVAEAQLKSARNLHDMQTQAHAAFCVHLGSIWGLRTDPTRVDALKHKIEHHVRRHQRWAKARGFMKLKTKKPDAPLSKDTKAIKEAVFKAYLGFPPKTPTGETSISRESLEDSGDKVLERFANLGRWEKFRTYLPTLEEAAVRPLNVSANILLSTGRMSYNGLVQLFPRKGGIRDCFWSRPDTSFCSSDYSAIELVTLAQVCLKVVGYSDLADAINSGKDPHCMMGAELIGTTYEEFLKRYEAGEVFIENIRQASKLVNFGLPGMMSALTFVIGQRKAGYSVCKWFFNDGQCGKKTVMEYKDRQLEVPICARCIEQAEFSKSAYGRRWGEMKPYWKWVTTTIENDDAITTLFTNRVRGSPTGPAAANNMFQGLAADGMKRAGIRLTAECYRPELESPLYGSRLLLMLHDETFMEHPLKTLHERAARQSQVMVEEMRKLCPDVIVKSKPAASLAWIKGAKPRFDENARLIPFDL